MKKLRLVFILFSVVLYACPFGTKYRYHEGTFPKTPVNLGDINSAYDDYNSTSPVMGGIAPLCFSSNRGSSGRNFDIIYKVIDVEMSKSNGKLSVEEDNAANPDVYMGNTSIYKALQTINTQKNELGPYLIPQGQANDLETYPFYYNKYILLYATDETGNLEIKLTQNLSNGTYSSPVNLKLINSNRDDAYPALNADNSMIYFCSDRETDFDIYSVNLNNNLDLLAELTDSSAVTVSKEQSLSSDYDDKCPFIMDNLMVFTSNRSGGYGGFDLYYSIFTDGSWSSPVNFGDKINSPYDEYRPIVKPYDEFTNDFMVFSSNRPGGKGGYDLYYVGINKMTE